MRLLLCGLRMVAGISRASSLSCSVLALVNRNNSGLSTEIQNLSKGKAYRQAKERTFLESVMSMATSLLCCGGWRKPQNDWLHVVGTCRAIWRLGLPSNKAHPPPAIIPSHRTRGATEAINRWRTCRILHDNHQSYEEPIITLSVYSGTLPVYREWMYRYSIHMISCT